MCGLHIACSFEAVLHGEYEAIRAECDAWLLDVIQPPSPAAAQFWKDCLLPMFCCLVYSECSAERLIIITKIIVWFFFFDAEEDDPALLAQNIARGRHQLILASFAGKELSFHAGIHDPSTVKQMLALHEVVQAMLQNVSPLLQARMLGTVKDYLNAIISQRQCHASGRLPEVDEYIAMRRADSLLYLLFQLIEYGLGMELDQETLDSELFFQLHDAAIDHVALANDVFSCHVEMSCNHDVNLLSVILYNSRDPGFTFEDARQRALSMVEDLDERFLQLLVDVQKSGLMQKPGFEAYVRSLQSSIAGNIAWSLKTARYKNKLSPSDEGIVINVPEPTPI